MATPSPHGFFFLVAALLLPGQASAGSPAESSAALAEDSSPKHLRVSVPPHAPFGPQSCEGEYELLGVRSHGFPVWKQWGGDRFLFHCDELGAWFFGDDQHLLQSCEGYVVSMPTFDDSPDFSELDWNWPTDGGIADGGDRASARMSVSAIGPPEMLDVGVCGHNPLGGAYAIMDGLHLSPVEPMPVWRMVNGGVYIYFCSSESTWYFNDRVAMENRECSGLIRPTSGRQLGAPLPDQIRSWDVFNRTSGWTTRRGCVTVEVSPFFAMRAEATSTIHAASQVLGLFLLLICTSRCMVRRCIRMCCLQGPPSASALSQSLAEPFLAFRQQRRSVANQAAEEAEDAAVAAMIADGTVGSGTCVICFDRPAIMTFVHGRTGHKACCPQCARQIPERKCPVCRQTYSSVILTFSV